MELTESVKVSLEAETDVSILGTGNFGQALAKRLMKSGVAVTIGSRKPTVLNNGLTTVTQEEALRRKIVIMAIPFNFHSSLPLEQLQPGTIVVDCSNRAKTCRPGIPSN